MGQQQAKERSTGTGGSLGGLTGSSLVSSAAAGGSTVDRHIGGSSIRSKSSSSSKPRAATVSAAATASGKERGILGSNIFTEHSGKDRRHKGKSYWRWTLGKGEREYPVVGKQWWSEQDGRWKKWVVVSRAI